MPNTPENIVRCLKCNKDFAPEEIDSKGLCPECAKAEK